MLFTVETTCIYRKIFTVVTHKIIIKTEANQQ